MYPRNFAQSDPDKPAVILSGSGERISFLELEETANQGAHQLRAVGLGRGGSVAILLENSPRFFEVYWAAQRAGLYCTPISTRLTAAEAAYIITDCGAEVLVTSAQAGSAPAELAAARARLIPGVREIFHVGRAPLAGAKSWSQALRDRPATPIADEQAGRHMVYSSGTTGKPKGIRQPLAPGPVDAAPPAFHRIKTNYGIGPDTVYLSPAPIYHAAPLGYTTMVHRAGGTVVMMEHFDPEAFLSAIETYRVTFTQVVPTMFVRLLKLSAETRTAYDLSSLKTVVHAAAPCPVPVKRQMIDWLGPIIHEYYSASEGLGSTYITPEEWLRKPGSVGRASWGVLHICDENGEELPAGRNGTVYFESGAEFLYYKDPKKTADACHPSHGTWRTVGDVGYVDEEGYLFLTDRKAFMIISGGVNIYPQEAENVIITHPKVADAAVFGVPNEEFGEEVKAIVQPLDWNDATPDFADEILRYCRLNLSAIKCPRSVDFEKELPRHPTGKLYKKSLRERYWPSGR